MQEVSFNRSDAVYPWQEDFGPRKPQLKMQMQSCTSETTGRINNGKEALSEIWKTLDDSMVPQLKKQSCGEVIREVPAGVSDPEDAVAYDLYEETGVLFSDDRCNEYKRVAPTTITVMQPDDKEVLFESLKTSDVRRVQQLNMQKQSCAGEICSEEGVSIADEKFSKRSRLKKTPINASFEICKGSGGRRNGSVSPSIARMTQNDEEDQLNFSKYLRYRSEFKMMAENEEETREDTYVDKLQIYGFDRVECSVIRADGYKSTECYKTDYCNTELEGEYSSTSEADYEKFYLSRSNFGSYDNDEDCEDEESNSGFIGESVEAPDEEEKGLVSPYWDQVWLVNPWKVQDDEEVGDSLEQLPEQYLKEDVRPMMMTIVLDPESETEEIPNSNVYSCEADLGSISDLFERFNLADPDLETEVIMDSNAGDREADSISLPGPLELRDLCSGKRPYSSQNRVKESDNDKDSVAVSDHAESDADDNNIDSLDTKPKNRTLSVCTMGTGIAEQWRSRSTASEVLVLAVDQPVRLLESSSVVEEVEYSVFQSGETIVLRQDAVCKPLQASCSHVLIADDQSEDGRVVMVKMDMDYYRRPFDSVIRNIVDRAQESENSMLISTSSIRVISQVSEQRIVIVRLQDLNNMACLQPFSDPNQSVMSIRSCREYRTGCIVEDDRHLLVFGRVIESRVDSSMQIVKGIRLHLDKSVIILQHYQARESEWTARMSENDQLPWLSEQRVYQYPWLDQEGEYSTIDLFIEDLEWKMLECHGGRVHNIFNFPSGEDNSTCSSYHAIRNKSREDSYIGVAVSLPNDEAFRDIRVEDSDVGNAVGLPIDLEDVLVEDVCPTSVSAEQLRRVEIADKMQRLMNHLSDQQLSRFLATVSEISLSASVQDLEILRAVKGWTLHAVPRRYAEDQQR